MLPSRAAFVEQARRAGLEVVNELAFGGDYARTLALWSAAFEAKAAAGARAQPRRGASSACGASRPIAEAAFAARQTDVIQFTLRAR